MQAAKRCRSTILRLAFLICAASWSGTQASPEAARVQRLPYRDGDILQVVNDAGVVEVRTWKEEAVEARWIDDTAGGDAGRSRVDFLKRQGKIFLIVSSQGNVPVGLELRVPPKARLLVQGIDPKLTIHGVNGLVMARTLRGRIDIVDSRGIVSAFSRSGEIHYQVTKPPVPPALLMTGGATVYCHVPESIRPRVEIATVDQAGDTQRIRHESADCTKTGGKTPCLRLIRRDRGRVYLYEGAEGTAWRDGASDDLGGPPELVKGGSSGPEVIPPPVKRGLAVGDAIPTFRVDVDWVRLNLAVTERRSGRRLFGLGADDFELYEDGILQEIQSLQGADEAFQVLLLLDVSGSTASYLPTLKRAVARFAATLRPRDRVALAAFNWHPFLVQGFTADKRLVKRALRKVPAGGGTGFYEALDFGLDALSQVTGRKALVVFTDGVDETLYGRFEQAADITYPEVLEKVKETDALVYAISLDSKRVLEDLMGRGNNEPLVEPILMEAAFQLRSIADHSGTPLYSPSRPRELGSIFDSISDDLKSRYTIAYRSSNPAKDGRWRELTVRVPGHPEYAVRTRRGYYAAASLDSAQGQREP